MKISEELKEGKWLFGKEELDYKLIVMLKLKLP